MESPEILRRLKEVATRSKELDSKLQETNHSFEYCADAVSEMEVVSDKVAKVFALYKDLVDLLNKYNASC
ncbi:ECU08_0575 [Encephalitozoon cuniculi GB-M1]|uniref:ECU08_0575 protein n=1 Tax=Encephalitozoon cuniculi (strain GB-M1) TaxID=284813 RepID=I7L4H9_ENCCU|nr:uncharacterized protein ECU08_0575 [Encephalitozoon cuniculi GB-M1]UYI26986.1 hypothetical protein J0A71_04g08330 [Encephalitozoon cuniculi]CCI73965.1 ECU08_0575 [Encephalitozoon cuniculi GB-M1]